MQYSHTLLLASVGLGLASPFALQDLPTTLETNLPQTLAEIELEQFENWSPEHLENDLQARKHVKICTASSARAGVCVAVTAVIAQVSLGIAGLVKGDSDKHDCKAHSGSIDGVSWKVYATGRNCDTSAELKTIQGAIAEYLRSVDDHVCGVHCLKLTHGGTWTGYVTLAPKGNNLDTFYCGSSNSFGHCVDGGKENVPKM
ncbi:hypothetical protein V8C40DRAFT_236752 [Trichoderma camerunense]